MTWRSRSSRRAALAMAVDFDANPAPRMAGSR